MSRIRRYRPTVCEPWFQSSNAALGQGAGWTDPGPARREPNPYVCNTYNPGYVGGLRRSVPSGVEHSFDAGCLDQVEHRVAAHGAVLDPVDHPPEHDDAWVGFCPVGAGHGRE